MSSTAKQARTVERVISASATSDGAGVNLYRSLGSPELLDLDPFLLLDEFRSDDPDDYIAGFPPHPHRGFETVTYMKAGHMQHEDSMGHKGQLRSGGVQWMTAASGIIHSELPQQQDGLMWGFQLWINLPAAQKMSKPQYQEFDPEQIPVFKAEGITVHIVAGEHNDIEGAVSGISTDPLYLDVLLEGNTPFTQALPENHSALIYVYDGSCQIEGQDVCERQLAVLGPGDIVQLQPGDSGCSFLLIAARPLEEPIARYGPFVMNTQEEIKQAIRDMQNNTLVQTA
jgi:hypothetical protein